MGVRDLAGQRNVNMRVNLRFLPRGTV